MLVFMEDEFSIVIQSLVSPVQSGNVFQIQLTLQGKTIFIIQATISWKNRPFDDKSATKSTSVGTHKEAKSLFKTV